MLVTSGAAMLGALLMLSHIRLHVVLNVVLEIMVHLGLCHRKKG